MRPLVHALAALAVVLVFAAVPARAEKLVYQTRAGAIAGYDPVAYFSESKPVKGKAAFSHEWMGAKWLFASAESRDAFARDPEKYAPQYNGYCAYGMAKGSAVEIDSTQWTIEGGKLYLNYSKSVRAEWIKDKAKYVAEADKNWPGVKAGLEP